MSEQIPDEAWKAARDTKWGSAPSWNAVKDGIEAAAPHITAAAGHRREIEVLKDWVSRCENGYYPSVDRLVAQMRVELATLEAGDV